MATFVLEDLEAAIEVMVFPKTMIEYGGLLEQDAIVVVRGRLDLREDQPKLDLQGSATSRAHRRPGAIPQSRSCCRSTGSTDSSCARSAIS